MPTALITGITGQDGLYLAEFLLSKGYTVYGMVRGQANPKVSIVKETVPEVKLVFGDLTDFSSLLSVLEESQPDEVYNLAAISYVHVSFQQPELTYAITGLGVHKMLEAVRRYQGAGGNVRFYQASSSEMFGKVRETPQNELTPFHPRSPYAIAKAMGHYATVHYREAYGMFACSGILFNHESPRRGPEFVTRKISLAVADIAAGRADKIVLGNLNARGYAPDYVRAMWLMLQQDEPSDYVVGTGESHSVTDFARLALAHIGISDYEKYLAVDERYMRPADVEELRADPTKARTVLGWEPTVSFEELVKMMVEADLAASSGDQVRKEITPRS
ncbi:MAG: GDP-mannose 4,6-dehydratase [Acidimicrobiia bacterium]